MKRSLAFIPPVVSRPIFSFKGLEGVARRRLINLAEILIAVWQYEIRLERSLMREAGTSGGWRERWGGMGATFG